MLHVLQIWLWTRKRWVPHMSMQSIRPLRGNYIIGPPVCWKLTSVFFQGFLCPKDQKCKWEIVPKPQCVYNNSEESKEDSEVSSEEDSDEQPPALTCPKLPIGTIGTCVEECFVGSRCENPDEICCSNGCGHVCMRGRLTYSKHYHPTDALKDFLLFQVHWICELMYISSGILLLKAIIQQLLHKSPNKAFRGEIFWSLFML